MLVYYTNIEMQKLSLTIYAIAFQNIAKHVINQRYWIKNRKSFIRTSYTLFIHIHWFLFDL